MLGQDDFVDFGQNRTRKNVILDKIGVNVQGKGLELNA